MSALISYRELEKPDRSERLDLVLYATVSSFESLPQPTRNDIHQFECLFLPLFDGASQSARRHAGAVLSRISFVPDGVIRRIIEAPIPISAPFIAHAPSFSECHAMELIAGGDRIKARVIARRETLSRKVVAALRSLQDEQIERRLNQRHAPLSQAVRTALPLLGHENTLAEPAPAPRTAETVREELRSLILGRSERPPVNASGQTNPPEQTNEQTKRPDAKIHILLKDRRRLVRFAENGEIQYFMTALADALGCSYRLAERIMFDISGRDLAMTLLASGVPEKELTLMLHAFFPYLARNSAGRSLATKMLDGLNRVEAHRKLTFWLHMDRSEGGDARKAIRQALPADQSWRESEARGGLAFASRAAHAARPPASISPANGNEDNRFETVALHKSAL